VTIKFTEKLIAKDPSLVSKDALEVNLISQTSVPDSMKTFSWKTVAFSAQKLTLKIRFTSPLSVSSETLNNLDVLEVRIKNPFMFRSEEGQLMPRGTWIQAEIPPLVPEGSAG
jgi:hypothetical protein